MYNSHGDNDKDTVASVFILLSLCHTAGLLIIYFQVYLT